MQKTPGNKRKSDESDAGRRKPLRQKGGSRMSDEFRLDDIDSQTMLDTLHPFESLDRHLTAFGMTPADIAQQFDFGSQRPPAKQEPRPKSVTSPPKLSNQARVDNFFSPTKPGVIDSRARQSNHGDPKGKQNVNDEFEQSQSKHAVVAPTFVRPPLVQTRSIACDGPSHKSASETHTGNGNGTHLDVSTCKVERKGLPAGGRKAPAAPGAAPTQPFVSADTSFNTSVDSRTTSFTSVFSSSGKTSAQTSFTETSESSRGAVHSFDDPFIERSPAKVLRMSASNARVTLPAAISFGSEHYHVRDFPSKGLFVPQLPNHLNILPVFTRYEVARLVQACKIEPDKLEDIDTTHWHDYNALYEGIVKHVADRGPRPPKASAKVWQAAASCSPQVMQCAALEFADQRSSQLFHLHPEPLHFDRSCRFFRKFGSNRFLKVTLPSFERAGIPEYLKIHQGSLHNRLREWLAAKAKSFLGCSWDVMYTKPRKDKAKLQTSSLGPRQSTTKAYDVMLFATDGPGLQPTSIWELLDWFMPYHLNGSLQACKAFARIELGLSKSIPTIVFKPEQIREIDDILADGTPEDTAFNDHSVEWPDPGSIKTKAVMNDGCSRISEAAADQIWTMLDGSGPRPSLFQARIGPWKGTWFVVPAIRTGSQDKAIWIEVTPSQRKFRRHSEDLYPTVCDNERLTFEVLKWPQKPDASVINRDFIPILADRGVARKILEHHAETMLSTISEALELSLSSRFTLIKWLDTVGKVDLCEDTSVQVASTPAAKAVTLLNARFEFTQSTPLQKLIKVMAKEQFKRASADMRIPIHRSTIVYGIADPLGVLAPGEIHLCFSGVLEEGSSEILLNGIEVLVARHPALRRSDIQKVKAVFRPDLADIHDAVVFPSRGQMPLASKLQGGDYDGDLFWVCWDQTLVAPFKNAPSPVASPNPADFGIQVDERKLSEFGLKPNSESFDFFMEAMLGFTVQPQLLGPVTNVHTRVSYWTDKLSSPALDRLADLHDLLVDYQKNGYNYPSDSWTSELQRLGLGSKTSEDPCYKRVDKTTLFDKETLGKLRHKDSNIMDHLVFSVAKGRAKAFISEIDQWTTGAISYDPEVGRLFHDTSRDPNATVRLVVRNLGKSMDDLFQKYGRSRGNAIDKDNGSGGGTGGGNTNAYADRIARLDKIEADHRQRYLALEPSADHLIQLVEAGWFRKIGCAPSHWQLLRASALMAVLGQKTNRFTGKDVAFRDDFILSSDLETICYLKLHARPYARPILIDAPVINHMKMRRVKIDLEQDAWWKTTNADDVDQTEEADKEEDDEIATQVDESDEDNSFHEAPEHVDVDMEGLTQDVAESVLTTPKKRQRS